MYDSSVNKNSAHRALKKAEFCHDKDLAAIRGLAYKTESLLIEKNKSTDRGI